MKEAHEGTPRFRGAAYFLSHGIGGVPRVIPWRFVGEESVDL